MAGNNGGARPGAGRPKGSKSKLSLKAREEAAAAGLLPHEWLLKVARGEPIIHRHYEYVDGPKKKRGQEPEKILVEEETYASLELRVDAAKAAAPYYAPRLSTQTLTVPPEGLTLNVKDKELTTDELKAELERRGLPTKLLKD